MTQKKAPEKDEEKISKKASTSKASAKKEEKKSAEKSFRKISEKSLKKTAENRKAKKKIEEVEDVEELERKHNQIVLSVICVITLLFALFTLFGVRSYLLGENEIQDYGIVGKLMIDGLIFLFGKTAWVMPLGLMLWSIQLVLRGSFWSKRMTAVMLLILSYAMYYSMEYIPRGLDVWEAAGYKLGGGYAGAALVRVFSSVMGNVGCRIIWLLFIFFAFILFIQRPVGVVFRELQGKILPVWERVSERVSHMIFDEDDQEVKHTRLSDRVQNTMEKMKHWGKRDKNIAIDSTSSMDSVENFAQENVMEQTMFRKPMEARENIEEDVKIYEPSSTRNGNTAYVKRTETSQPQEQHPGFDDFCIFLGEAPKGWKASDELPPLSLEWGFPEEVGQEYLDENFEKALAQNVQNREQRNLRKVSSFAKEDLSLVPQPEPLQEETATEVSADSTKPVYVKPPLTLLHQGQSTRMIDKNAIREKSEILEKTLADFGITVKIENIVCGPAITRFEMVLAPGTKVSKVVSLSDDLQMCMAASGIRIEAPIPGKSAVGIEIPNQDIRSVGLYDILASDEFQAMNHPLTFSLGENITGNAICARLKDMPHLLIAGSTGSGKSVCINGIIMSLLFHATPDEVKLVLIDPKMVELAVYNNLPHLMTPVVTNPKRAAQILTWMTKEMERRYQCFAQTGVRDINRYREVTGEMMPYIVIIIDELADLMMVSANEVEDSICRLAQMARAAGMHLIVATQRPSVDVVTGIIKANIPSRIAFAVSSQMDSRTILDMGGAEKLLGKGDMLFLPVGASKPQRIQGAFVSDEEIEKTVNFITQQNQDKVEYNQDLENLPLPETEKATVAGDTDEALFLEAIRVVVENKKASASFLQRKLRIGFSRAARLMDMMEEQGIISIPDTSSKRTVLVGEDFLRELQKQYS